MKIRKGFVSNSSSTSFCIVGISAWDNEAREVDTIVTELAKADDCDEMGGYGYSEGRTLLFIGGEGYGEDEDDPYEPDYAGLEAEADLKAGKTVQDIAAEFIAKAKALGFDIPKERVTLHYGECSDGG